MDSKSDEVVLWSVLLGVILIALINQLLVNRAALTGGYTLAASGVPAIVSETGGPVQIEGEAVLININRADAEMLDLLDGIGPVLSARIVAYREEHGPFASIEQLMEVDGIGEKLMERIRDKICLE